MGNTATEAKKRYNTKTYDHITTYVNKGGKDLINLCAQEQGKTVAQYIRDLIIQDAQKQGYNDAEQQIDLGGGGVA